MGDIKIFFMFWVKFEVPKVRTILVEFTLDIPNSPGQVYDGYRTGISFRDVSC